ncbi:MAG TPA: MiaB/RimO family radical SAM methylthiotransferase, partial [Clostridia bacterium]
MRTVAFYTLGCKVNQYETDALAGIFKDSGYKVVGFEEKADVYVINTCTVTSLSDRKSRQMIRRARNLNKDAIVVAAGCYAQTSPDEVGAMEEVNLVLGTKERASIMDYIKEIEEGNDKLSIVGDIAGERKFEDLKIDESSGRTRAHIKIQEGCSQFCAYCIIPYARGPVRSRLPEEIVMEAGRLSSAGFKEIVLTGIHIASYGKDIGNSLGEIIKRVHEVQGIDRIRLGSVEPNIVTDEFLKIIASCEKLCPHFHVSLQSGCDETLKRMNRKYTTQQYKRA